MTGKVLKAIGSDTVIITRDGKGFSMTLTQLVALAASGLANVVEDLSPQLGGTLDLNTFDILASSTDGPALVDEDATPQNPTLIISKSDLSTGVGGEAGDISLINAGIESLLIDTGGAVVLRQTGGSFRASNVSGPTILNEAATAINPTVVHNRSSSNSGVGGVAGATSLIAGGVERITVNATGIGFFATTPVARPTGVAVTDVAIHAALVALGLITA